MAVNNRNSAGIELRRGVWNDPEKHYARRLIIQQIERKGINMRKLSELREPILSPGRRDCTKPDLLCI